MAKPISCNIRTFHCKTNLYVLCYNKVSIQCFPTSLRYYATFKVRKIELLFYKINTFLQETNIYIGLQIEQIFSANL